MLSSPERTKILSGQRGESPRAHLFHRAETGDAAVLHRLLPIVRNERTRLLAIDLEALAHGVLAVVVALHERLAGQIVPAGAFRWIVFLVVHAPGCRMHAPAAHTSDDVLVGHVDLEHAIERDPRLRERLGLGNGARKAIEQ